MLRVVWQVALLVRCQWLRLAQMLNKSLHAQASQTRFPR
jgi:hypothetical protein